MASEPKVLEAKEVACKCPYLSLGMNKHFQAVMLGEEAGSPRTERRIVQACIGPGPRHWESKPRPRNSHPHPLQSFSRPPSTHSTPNPVACQGMASALKWTACFPKVGCRGEANYSCSHLVSPYLLPLHCSSSCPIPSSKGTQFLAQTNG